MKPTNRNDDGLALQGYDPVAYWQNGPKQGSAQFAAKHLGTTYHFSSAANRDLFTANPSKYLPEYGGFCATAVSENKIFDANPERFRILNNRLFLFYNGELGDTLPMWTDDEANRLANADRNWNV